MTQQEKQQYVKNDKGLIYYIALKYYRKYGLEKDDAIQYCYMAYWTGLDLWNPEKGTLSAFMGTRLQQRLKIAGRRERAIKGVRNSSVTVINEAEGFQPNTLEDDSTPEQEYFNKVYLMNVLNKVLSTLGDRDQAIVRSYYIGGQTYETLAKQYGISRQRVVQIMKQVKEKIKEKI